VGFVPNWVSSAPTLVAVLLVATGLAIRLVALGVIPGNRKPSTGVAWLLLVLLSPVVGLVAFAFFGSPRIGRGRHARQVEIKAKIAARTEGLAPVETPPGTPAYVHSVVALNRGLGSLPLVEGNTVEVLEDYRGTVQAMAAAVDRAAEYVHVQFYIMAWDEVTDAVFAALVRATERGVAVRLLYDHLGSRGIPGYQDFLRRLSGTRIDAHPMLPVQPLKGRFQRPDLRNHRKLLVVDGEVGFTGSQNLTEPGYNKPKNHELGREWVELMVRLEGPTVTSLESVFAADWFTETEELLEVRTHGGSGVPRPDALHGVVGQLVPSGPGYPMENNLRMFTTLLYSAQRRISLTSPYFVPDESLLYAVTTAAQRGVDIELFVSELSDQFMVGHAQASYYRALLEAGVRIYRYPAPYILHSKHFTVDDDVAVIGSSNMDMRSFALNYEISLMLLGPDVVRRMRHVEDRYRAISKPLSMEEWSDRPARLKYVDNVMRLTAALQ
jgi:cardiolipin synthase